MVTFLIATLALSIAGMLSLLLIKRYELNTGRIFLASARPSIGEFFHRRLMWLEYVLPGLMRVGASSVYRSARRLAHVWLALIAVRLEQGLEQALRRIRSTTARVPRAGQGRSAFLREVAEHKKKLQDENPDRGTVLEE